MIEIPEGCTEVLLHACCAPCSSAIVEWLVGHGVRPTIPQYVHEEYPQLRVAWYSGRTVISPLIRKNDFDYIKIGPFIKHLGPLKKPTTNQRLYRQNDQGEFEDITSRFWRQPS